jgi:hypothetical protein
MANEWLNGKLNWQVETFILHERFGHLIFDETKQRMEGQKPKKGLEFKIPKIFG